MTSFRPHIAFDVFDRHHVAFIVVGGLAGNMLGVDRVTGDLDICYRRDDANLKALAASLKELGAELRGAPAGLPFILDARTLRNGDCFTFATIAGAVDCLGTPAGTKGYDDLYESSWVADIDGRSVRICSLDDLIRMKKAARREKDLGDLQHLMALKKLTESDSSSS